jgi:ribosomal protein S18 acetylase RimI-like enzyme
MTAMSPDAPFGAARYDLRPARELAATGRLSATTEAEAAFLGEALARIDPWARLGATGMHLASFLANPSDGKRCFTVTADGELAGAISVRFPWLGGPYLNLLAILPAYQRAGLGGAALGWMEAEARRAGARNCWLCVSAFNTSAIAFYLSHGYAEAAVLDDLIKDGEDEILMRKRLVERI